MKFKECALSSKNIPGLYIFIAEPLVKHWVTCSSSPLLPCGCHTWNDSDSDENPWKILWMVHKVAVVLGTKPSNTSLVTESSCVGTRWLPILVIRNFSSIWLIRDPQIIPCGLGPWLLIDTRELVGHSTKSTMTQMSLELCCLNKLPSGPLVKAIDP